MSQAQFPLQLLPWVSPTFVDGDGHPVANGLLYIYLAGTTTPTPMFADAQGTTPLPNPVTLSADGRLVAYWPALGIKVDLHDSDDVPVAGWPIDNITNVNALLMQRLGGAAGSRNVTSGYTVLATDDLVTVDGTGGANPCIVNLPPAADQQLPVAVKNLGTVPLRLTPHSPDTIENGTLTTYDVPASATPLFPTVTLHSDGVSNWYIVGGIGI